MDANHALAGFIAGVVTAALDEARDRGYPAKVNMLPPDESNGSWTVEVFGTASICTVTVWPGPASGLATSRSPG
jgi:hypothetical protein